jgi:peptidoglycan hydrolase-like protein with peptidoglycan-binding domain
MTMPRHLPHLARTLALGAGLGAGLGCAHTREAPPPSAVAPTKPDHEQAAETGLTMASTPQGLMRDGAEEKIQRRLLRNGFLRGEAAASGRLDPATREALRRFQKSEGLPATGLPSYEAIEHLRLDPDEIFHTVAHPREPAPRPTD